MQCKLFRSFVDLSNHAITADFYLLNCRQKRTVKIVGQILFLRSIDKYSIKLAYRKNYVLKNMCVNIVCGFLRSASHKYNAHEQTHALSNSMLYESNLRTLKFALLCANFARA